MCDFPAKELLDAERKWHNYNAARPQRQCKNNIRLLLTIMQLGWDHEYSTGCDCVRRRLHQQREEIKREEASFPD